ncbi:sigma factor-like helix-turn-helix DNA-binding protein [Sinorhizobium sp. RAC02]|uniref:sigma factor-like helix-turn-helix DNA-binding protein n=1 Tax=Sinorhizobium sp. RAC02 TaxID=1842534 RepID=UPI00085829D8|nr:sigma factor-like helix-turn-helix DNA-binding protein [Sinorhizobium sp. RAC02]AOF93166.1 sigma-70, region 4 family protein [Sinorhizobium sp. RAC02]
MSYQNPGEMNFLPPYSSPVLLDCCSTMAISPAIQEWHVQGRAIGHLGPNQRQIGLAILLDGISYENAGQRAGCNIGTVESRYNRAREKLVTELSPPQ